MESLSSLTFKGSITEAIFEAKSQKKLFVVYISGEDEESDKLNKLTWTDASVAESLSKYCILLHIQSGSVDATNFSAIYPYSSVPFISAIGFTGTQVWKNEGFVAAEDLASSLEKAWVGLHIQETTASMLSAALASQNSDQPAPNVFLPSEEGGSLDSEVATPLTTSESASTKENNNGTAAVKGNTSAEPTNSCDNAKNQSASSPEETKDNGEHKETSPHVQTEQEPIHPASSRPNDNSSNIRSSTDRKRKQGTETDSGSDVRGRDISIGKIITPKEEAGKVEDEESSKKSSDVHLNIRLPDGGSLQEKFHVTSLLRIVKDYVNSNQIIEFGAYDLAVPYPRKVYSDQDLDKSLSELGLLERQALVVVPRKRGPSYLEFNNTDSVNHNNGGYFAYVRRLMSYANPFSYFGGRAEPERQSSTGEYGVDSERRNNLEQAGLPFQDRSESRSNVRNRRLTSSRIGSNIHTLKHDEEDAPFGDGNAFWNGNSTQYGGGSGGDSNDRR